jgi:coenzyme F420 hydrogenase subunit beta
MDGNMVQKSKTSVFKGISTQELMGATYEASENFQIRAFFEAKEEILEVGKYSEEEFYEILDAMIDAETERKLVLDRLRGFEPLFLEEIAKKVKEFPFENVIRDVLYLKEQGYIEEEIEIKTKKVIKKIKGEEKEVEVQEFFFRYQVRELPDDFIEHYFEPVSIVFDAGACCQCGWCSSVCPVDAIKVTGDTLEVDDETCMKCGVCFSVCPRSFSIEQAAQNIKKLTKSLKYSNGIGGYINAYSGTTSDKQIIKVRQDGGIVTAIFKYLLKNKVVDAIVAVQHSSDFWRPEPVFIENFKNLYKTGGTKYANSPSLTIIDKAKNYDNIAIVGVPCMINALEKGTMYPGGVPFFKNIKFRIGIFCMESFPYEGIVKLTQEQFDEDLHNITKMDISRGKFILSLKSGDTKEVPLKDVKAYARHNCHYCEDLTADYADISVGSIGSPGGRSSIITRTKEGDALLKKVAKSGLIELQSLKETKPGQGLLERIALSKRKNCQPIKLKE